MRATADSSRGEQGSTLTGRTRTPPANGVAENACRARPRGSPRCSVRCRSHEPLGFVASTRASGAAARASAGILHAFSCADRLAREVADAAGRAISNVGTRALRVVFLRIARVFRVFGRGHVADADGSGRGRLRRMARAGANRDSGILAHSTIARGMRSPNCSARRNLRDRSVDAGRCVCHAVEFSRLHACG